MFEKSLTDLIQGLRANKRNETVYIQKSLEEIQSEVHSSDMYVKSAAIDKLNYLHMFGYDMNWANFNVVEVMAAQRFGEKRSGYLAAAQSFHQETDVLMLTTNLIRKDLASANDMEVGVALDGLAQIATPELSMDLFDDALAVLGHSRPYIRKKAFMCLHKMVLKYPEGLHAFVPRLKEHLDDPDPSVVSAAVTVICELAHTNPRNYMPLAPKLYHLLNTLSNNWILIKIVKLFASLASIEPRLAKKIHSPLSQLVCTTTAMSLLYECIHTAIVADVISIPIPIVDSIGREVEFAELCTRKLALLYETPDQNVRCVGLVALALMQQKRPDLASMHFEPVLEFLDDPDQTIRMRALEAVSGMVTRKTLAKTVKLLMSQLILSNTISLQPGGHAGPMAGPGSAGPEAASMLDTPFVDSAGTTLTSASGTIITPRKASAALSDPADNPEYRLNVVEAIIDMCSRNSYGNLSNFEWYVATLVDLVYVAGVDVGKLLSAKLLDVTVRVRQVREFGIKMARGLLSDNRLMGHIASNAPQAAVVTTAAYILGEYCTLLPASADDIGLLLPKNLSQFAPDQQAVLVQAAIKVFTYWLQDISEYWNADVWDVVRSVLASTLDRLSYLLYSEDANSTAAGSPSGVDGTFASLPLQLSSRLRHFVEVIKAISVSTSNLDDSAPRVCHELHFLFTAYELNPVSAAAQGKVPVPEGLDLDSFIGDMIPDTTLAVIPPPSPRHTASGATGRSRGRDPHRNKDDPFYLGSNASAARGIGEFPDVDDIPVVALDLSHADPIQAKKSTDKRDKKKKSKKDNLGTDSRSKRHRKRKEKTPSPSPPRIPVEIAGDEDMPDIGSEEAPQLQKNSVSDADRVPSGNNSETGIVGKTESGNAGKGDGDSTG
ncbi:AP-3 complex subunit delta [Coemansia sp. RSA 1813]|nr:AP-3 complex subunit delta [Coemansia sp. RSA 1843]KAJ2214030.1 AP-3 complex subunit delta [Coemansia sp. RSA 487]KAJ2571271.1 AP-3 complex subunit delta [Coemansia sp. RSA 1813]